MSEKKLKILNGRFIEFTECLVIKIENIIFVSDITAVEIYCYC